MINEQAAYAFCREPIENIENYEEAVNSKEKYVCHHKNGSDFTGFSKTDLIKMKMYYHRPASELIFLKKVDHQKYHKNFLGHKHSEETKEKIAKSSREHRHTDETKMKLSENHKGLNTWTKGRKLSEHQKRCISLANKGRKLSEEHIKKLSKAHTGKHWKIIEGKRVYY